MASSLKRSRGPRLPVTIDTILNLLSPLAHPFAPLLTLYVLRRSFISKYRFTPKLSELVSYGSSGRTTLIWLVLSLVIWSNKWLTRILRNRGISRSRLRWNEPGGEIVLITGGASGIGRELVELLGNRRLARVAVLDVVEPKSLPGNALFFKCDISKAESVVATAEEVRATVGEPTILVNNAGILRGKPILDLTSKEYETTLKVNTLGAFHILREFLPSIVKNNHGHIITTASTAALVTPPGMADYCGSKAALLCLHEALEQELRYIYKASNVRTTVILPTKVATSLGLAVADHPSAFFTPNLHPYTVARLMLSSIDSGLSHYHVVPAFAAFIPWTRSLPLAYEEFLRWTSKLHEYVSEKTREVGRKGGYKITVDDEHE